MVVETHSRSRNDLQVRLQCRIRSDSADYAVLFRDFIPDRGAVNRKIPFEYSARMPAGLIALGNRITANAVRSFEFELFKFNSFEFELFKFDLIRFVQNTT